jgi:hypothetical protein
MKRELKAIIGQYVEEMGTGNRFYGIHERKFDKLISDLGTYIRIRESNRKVEKSIDNLLYDIHKISTKR